MFFLRAAEHTVGRLLADGVLDDGDFSGYCFLLVPSESYVAGSYVVKEFTFDGMKVRL